MSAGGACCLSCFFDRKRKGNEMIKLKEYIPLARRTAKPLDRIPALLHGAMGISSDAGELITHIKSYTIYRKSLHDLREGFMEEIGDVLWFVVYMADAAKIDPEKLEPWHANWPMSLEESALLLAKEAGNVSVWVWEQAYRGASPSSDTLLVYLKAILGLLIVISSRVDMSLWMDCAPYNIGKLRLRYPDKYTDVDAIARADKQQIGSGG